MEVIRGVQRHHLGKPHADCTGFCRTRDLVDNLSHMNYHNLAILVTSPTPISVGNENPQKSDMQGTHTFSIRSSEAG